MWTKAHTHIYNRNPLIPLVCWHIKQTTASFIWTSGTWRCLIQSELSHVGAHIQGHQERTYWNLKQLQSSFVCSFTKACWTCYANMANITCGLSVVVRWKLTVPRSTKDTEEFRCPAEESDLLSPVLCCCCNLRAERKEQATPDTPLRPAVNYASLSGERWISGDLLEHNSTAETLIFQKLLENKRELLRRFSLLLISILHCK